MDRQRLKTLTRGFLAAGLALSALSARAAAAEKPVVVELYVMSLCPFGIEAENGIFPAVKALGKAVDLRLNFIANEGPAIAAGKPSFNSLHGAPEVEENIRQLCMGKHYPASYLDFILERNKSSAQAADWQAAVAKLGGDPKAIEACAGGAEGAALLSLSIKASEAKRVNSSPTIYINGAAYSGARRPRSFTLAVCAALKASGQPEPEACRQALSLPPDPAPAGGDCGDGAKATPAVFDVWVVKDSACKACAPTMLDTIKSLHPAAVIKIVEAESPQGKALIAKHRARALPLYILDKMVEKDEGFRALQNSYYAKSADQYILRPGNDTYAPSVQLDRKRVPRHLDIFLSPLSAFAVQAQLELARFLAQSDVKDITFSMHYIVQESAKADEKTAVSRHDGTRSASLKELTTVSTDLTSSNGEAELRESLRQACLFQHSSVGNYFAYFTCRSARLQDESWADSCLKAEDAAIAKCVAGPEGRDLLRQDAKLVRDLSINTTISLFWENRYGPFGWNEVDWKGLLLDQK